VLVALVAWQNSSISETATWRRGVASKHQKRNSGDGDNEHINISMAYGDSEMAKTMTASITSRASAAAGVASGDGIKQQ